MKTKLSILFVLFALTVMAGDKYTDQMTKYINLVYKSQTITELQDAVNALDRIGQAEKTKWEPYYYASFGNIMLATKEIEAAKKDSYLDQAKAMLDKALAINSNESEIVALEGFIYTIRLSIDPATRGQQYSMLSMQAFGKALALNPNNPRALSLMAQMQYGTAQFFGSSTTEACATLTKALEKFESNKPENVLAPQWGKGNAEGMKGQCK